MNGIEKITQRIDQDAQAEIDAIIAQAQTEADAITARYAAQAEKETADIVARGKVHAQERKERLASMADMEAKKVVLGAKQQMLDEAFALALEKLAGLPEEQYVALLTSLAVEASSTGKEKIILSQSDRARYGVKVATGANEKLAAAGKPASLTLSEETRPIRGGLLLSDGDVEVNCAFETLIRLSRSELSGEVLKILFG